MYYQLEFLSHKKILFLDKISITNITLVLPKIKKIPNILVKTHQTENTNSVELVSGM